jgi:microcystin-dependent protein
MAQPFVGEIRLFAGNFAPAGWAFCDGQLMPIAENETLWFLIGTTYGGDGQETFALPNLQSRVPIHMGTGPGLSSRQIGEQGGTEQVTLTTQQIPAHSHAAMCRSTPAASTSDPANAVWAASDVNQYSDQAPTVAMGTPNILSTVQGGSQPHDNMIPFLCVNYIISLFGIFPQPN